MKNLVIILCIFICTSSFTQERYVKDDLQEKKSVFAFYVRISNSKNVPQILSKTEKRTVLKHKNLKIQSVFNKYKIYDFIRAFPTAKTQSLREAYLIRCNSNKLLHELKAKFPTDYMYFEKVIDETILLSDVNNYNVLYTPNDYGFSIPQTDLDLINAQQAWDFTTGNPNLKLGITDTEFNIYHEELEGTINRTGNNSTNLHGSAVALNMAGNTNNGKGLASIGHSCFIEANTSLWNMNTLLQMSQAGIRVINGSWSIGYSFNPYYQEVVNEIYNNGTTLVFAAGNTQNNTRKVYPAAYDNVISVTSIHHKNFMQPTYDENHNFTGNVLRKIDTHDNTWVLEQIPDGSHNHSYAVDLAAPGYEVPTINWNGVGYGVANGTSHAAPEVAGTIGLMLSVNDAIMTDEIESILKLTSADIYNIPENNNYIDKLGAGRLDAGKAVEMAYNMAQPQGIVDVENRDFYRDWSFELKNAPYQINIQNQIFRDTIKVDFIARNNIELENTLIEPNSLGYTVLSIDPNIPLPLVPSSVSPIITKLKSHKPSFSEKSIYKLEYFLVNDNREDLVLINDNNSDEKLEVPYIEFEMNSLSNQLELPIISGFCNITEAIYKDKGSFLEVNSRGETTLTDCNNNAQEYRFFNIVTGFIYEQDPSKKVYYELSEDKNDLWLWVEPNEKLFFTKTTFRTNENDLNNLIKIFPNPASNYLQIETKGIEIPKVTIIDLQGKEILVKTNNLDRINVSNLSKGVYFIKLNTPNTTITKKIILQ